MIDRAYIRIAEGQLHLRHVESEASALPLVLMHASPASSQALEPLLLALDDTRPLVAFDTPGNGQSCAPAVADPLLGDYADMLSRACDALGHERVMLYGTHTGSHIAIEWALAHPDRVAGIVLDGIAVMDAATRTEFLDVYAPPKKPDEIGSQFHWAWQYMRDQMIFWPHYKKDADHMRQGGAFDAETLHWLTLDILNNLETYHQPYRAVFRHDVEAALARLSVPTLFVFEGHSPLDADAKDLPALVNGAAVAHDCGTPAAKAAAINAFVKDFDLG